MTKSPEHPSVAEQGLTLVMKGGGMKGIAYIGAIRELQPFYGFDTYVGTSAGAITAALLGAGYTVDEMDEELGKKNFSDFLTERFRRITNLIFHGGLYKGLELTYWRRTERRRSFPACSI
jgi:predicted acylesterase/phospholipase RssA